MKIENTRNLKEYTLSQEELLKILKIDGEFFALSTSTDEINILVEIEEQEEQ